MGRTVIRTQSAPGAIGPYSQAIQAAGQLWVSGQIPIDPSSGALVDGGIEAQTAQALQNLAAVIQAAGLELRDVVRVTLWLTDLADFDKVNRVYGEFFRDEPPARVCVQVSALPRGAAVEIDAIAVGGNVS